jgi:ATP-dependent DNA helicase RecG
MDEKQNIEWKENWRDDYLKWVCGFANSQGGTIFIGKDDAGNVSGLDNYQKLLEDLPNKIRDSLGIFVDVNLHEKDGNRFIEIIVPKYQVPIAYRGKYYIRSGSTKQELKGAALNEFILKRSGKTWDDVIEENASFDDIDGESIKQFLKDASKANRINVESDISIPDLLDKLRLSDGNQVKRAAIILFGKDPGRFYTNLPVKIGSFGDSSADLKFHEVVEGNLIQLKDLIPEMLNAKFLKHPIDFQGLQRFERDEYPVDAVREMILNALVHRNYLGAQTQLRLQDHSLSIWNDGTLPDGITEADLKRPHASKPRNPLIADVCFKAGYIDSWGRGTIRILEACDEFDLPEPEMTEFQGGFKVTLYKDHYSEEQLKKLGLNERQIKAVKFVKNHAQITNAEYQEEFDVARRTATRDLKELVEKGVLKSSDKKGAGAYYEI